MHTLLLLSIPMPILLRDMGMPPRRSLWSAREFGEMLLQVAKVQE